MRQTALVIAIAGIGGVGAVLRFILDGAVQRRVAGGFPAGTLTVNLMGSFALGVLIGVGVAGDAFLLLGTAALGSFTTFSTWMLEADRLGEDGELAQAGLNIAVSLAGGLLAAALGRGLGGLL
ncbi:MAG: fluoride efflux transporter CrcB [Actinobacteria bacterium]|nr:fluoride efflux transporter CrcB [Actinomycetota bacterium]